VQTNSRRAPSVRARAWRCAGFRRQSFEGRRAAARAQRGRKRARPPRRACVGAGPSPGLDSTGRGRVDWALARQRVRIRQPGWRKRSFVERCALSASCRPAYARGWSLRARAKLHACGVMHHRRVIPSGAAPRRRRGIAEPCHSERSRAAAEARNRTHPGRGARSVGTSAIPRLRAFGAPLGMTAAPGCGLRSNDMAPPVPTSPTPN